MTKIQSALFVVVLLFTSLVSSQELKQACIPGELQCQMQSLMECNETGTGWEVDVGVSPMCCTPGERECQISDLMACNETGDGWMLVKEDDESCVSVCNPGERQCQIGGVMICTRDGRKWAPNILSQIESCE